MILSIIKRERRIPLTERGEVKVRERDHKERARTQCFEPWLLVTVEPQKEA